MTEPLDQWIEREFRYAASALLKSISRTDLVKTRPGFCQTVRAVKGSVIASPVLASYDPDPDYFFHWFRDSAIVIDALRLLYVGRAMRADDALSHLADFVRFSRSLQQVQGRALTPEQRAKVAPDFVQYLRDDAELAAVRGENVVAETRVNPDGTLDISRWNRPQHDGPPLRALTLLRWARSTPLDAEASALVRADIDFTLRHWREPSFDIWEEEKGLHYYTLRVSAAALDAAGEHAATKEILQLLDDSWVLDENVDIAVILAAIHAGDDGDHSVHDPRMQSTLAALERHFADAYPINRGRTAPALGRYPGDVYYEGGAWYVSTLAAAEFCYRAGWMERGDAFLDTVRAFTPGSGEMSEQFDQRTGAQKSARHLAWSYAAFISCVEARAACAG